MRKAFVVEHEIQPRADGLRRGEARRLLWDDVKLDASPPTVRLPAAITKNDKTSVQLLGDLVGELASLWGNATDEEPVFADGVVSMREWKRLLKAAGISYLDGQGRQAEVHALRYTLCPNLARASVAVQTAMAIMGHNDVKLTTRIYMDAGQLPRGDAMALVPTFAQAMGGGRS